MNEAGKKEKERALERLNKMDNITIVSGAPHNLEVNAKDVSKGKGIYKLCDLLNIDRKRTCACGDDINDLDMIKLSGFGVAMGNAVPAVKSAADFITDTNEEAGVAKAIYKFMDIEYLKNS